MLKYICLIATIFFINGCISTDYAGFYNLSRDSESFANRLPTADEFSYILNAIRNTAEEFGFAETDKANLKGSSYDFVDMFKKHGIKTQYDHLKGSDSVINVNMVIDPKYMSILIRDRENTYETDFIKTLKAKLENELSKKIDMKKVRFKRKTFSMT